jgi:hypothetical protein
MGLLVNVGHTDYKTNIYLDPARALHAEGVTR